VSFSIGKEGSLANPLEDAGKPSKRGITTPIRDAPPSVGQDQGNWETTWQVGGKSKSSAAGQWGCRVVCPPTMALLSGAFRSSFRRHSDDKSPQDRLGVDRSRSWGIGGSSRGSFLALTLGKV
jgi:hypothetical protein